MTKLSAILLALSCIFFHNAEAFSVTIPSQLYVDASVNGECTSDGGAQTNCYIEWFFGEGQNETFITKLPIPSYTTSGSFYINSNYVPVVGSYQAKYVQANNSVAAVSNVGYANIQEGFNVSVPSTFPAYSSVSVQYSTPSQFVPNSSSPPEICWYYVNGNREILLTCRDVTQYLEGTVVFDPQDSPYSGSYKAKLIGKYATIFNESNIAVANYVGYSVSVPSQFAVGSSVALNWQAPNTHNQYDHIDWYFVNGETQVFLTRFVLQNTGSSRNFTIPSEFVGNVGQYAAVYFLNSEMKAIAKSMRTATLQGYNITIPETFSVGLLSGDISWTAPVGHSSNDQIVWCFLQEGGNEKVIAAYPVIITGTSGSVSYNHVVAAGSYQAKYVVNNIVVASSNIGVANFAGYSINIPPQFAAQSTVSIEWHAPPTHFADDTIWWCYVDGQTELVLKVFSVYTGQSSGTIMANTPHTGNYVAKYITGDSVAVAVGGVAN